MDETFIRQRITELRMKKDVSEYRMSTEMGRSKNYIQGITSGRSLPSLSEFLYMCEYLGVTPRDFFDASLKNPALLQEVIDALKTLDDEDLILTLSNIRRLHKHQHLSLESVFSNFSVDIVERFCYSRENY